MTDLQKILDNTVAKKAVFGATISVQTHNMKWHGAGGNLKLEDSFFIASTTKLFITALILKLKSEEKIKLDDRISNFLPPSVINGLHQLNGIDYSNEITVQQLLAHTSGLPDYFKHKRENGISLENELVSGKDQSWAFDEAISDSKKMTPYFKPGQRGKAHYSDTNFQLLGKIIEKVQRKDLAIIIQEHICVPLGLKNTYLFENIRDNKPQAMHYKQNSLHIPKAMASFRADGGIVSTASDLMAFIQAFFNGDLFPKKYAEEIQEWNRIFFPLRSGIGIHQYKLPWILSPFRPIPDLIGHSGLSGAFAFYSPEKQIYLTGTVNQIHPPSIPYKLMIQLLLTLNKSKNHLM